MTQPEPAWTEETFALVREGVRLANEAFSQDLSPEWHQKISERALELSNVRDNTLQPGNLNVVIFHVKIPADAGEIKAPDIRNLDHDKVDYETLIRLNINIALKTNPRSRVFLLTDHSFLHNLAPSERLHISRLDVNAREPMFERVLTMAAYVRSTLFDQPTVFLDSDAFLLRPIHNLFANNFDVGLTHRNIKGQMPINEGVIFVNNMNKNAVKSVFDSYVASYLSIEADTHLAKLYSKLRRWRGGQLSINSVGQGFQMYSTGIDRKKNRKISMLPCSVYNLSQINDTDVNPTLKKRSHILHLKGPRKSWIMRLNEII